MCKGFIWGWRTYFSLLCCDAVRKEVRPLLASAASRWLRGATWSRGLGVVDAWSSVLFFSRHCCLTQMVPPMSGSIGVSIAILSSREMTSFLMLFVIYSSFLVFSLTRLSSFSTDAGLPGRERRKWALAVLPAAAVCLAARRPHARQRQRGDHGEPSQLRLCSRPSYTCLFFRPPRCSPLAFQSDIGFRPEFLCLTFHLLAQLSDKHTHGHTHGQTDTYADTSLVHNPFQ